MIKGYRPALVAPLLALAALSISLLPCAHNVGRRPRVRAPRLFVTRFRIPTSQTINASTTCSR
jgi:hypothetical protein